MACWRLPRSKSFRLRAGFGLSVSCQEQKLPPSAGDFCYGKSHQNHLRRTAAATRFPARLARQAPRRTRGHPWPSDNRRLLACRAAMLGSLQGAASQKHCVSIGGLRVHFVPNSGSVPRRLLLFLRLKSTPSGAAWRGAKVRMFERMDARVRTGPRHASRAGHRRVAPTCVRREWFCRLLP